MGLLITCATAASVPLPPPPVPSPPPGSLEWEARIVGSTRYAGLLEVRRRGTSIWGTVCDDYFSNNAAIAACHSVGFANASNAVFISNSFIRSPGGSGPILLDDVYCYSSDLYLDNCTKLTTRHNCGHYEDVTINCFPDQSFNDPAPANASQWEYQLDTSGGLQVRPTNVSAWGYFGIASVSNDSLALTTLATVACRSLGFAAGTSALVASIPFLSPTVVYWTNVDIRLSCSGDHTTVAGAVGACGGGGFQTEFTRPTAASRVPAIQCTSERQWQAAQRDVRNKGWQFRFWADDLPPEGTPSAHVLGLLLLRPSASQPWGLACRSGFTTTEAAAACRSLGFRVPSTSVAVTTVYWGAGGATTPIYLSNVRCDPTSVDDGEPLLPQCTFSQYSASSTRFGCSRSQVVQLQCGSAPLPPANGTRAPTNTDIGNGSGREDGDTTSSAEDSGGTSIAIFIAVPAGILAVIIVFVVFFHVKRKQEIARQGTVNHSENRRHQQPPARNNPLGQSRTGGGGSAPRVSRRARRRQRREQLQGQGVQERLERRRERAGWTPTRGQRHDVYDLAGLFAVEMAGVDRHRAPADRPWESGSEEASDSADDAWNGAVADGVVVEGSVSHPPRRRHQRRQPATVFDAPHVPYGTGAYAEPTATAAVGHASMDVDAALSAEGSSNCFETMSPTSREVSTLYPAALPQALPVAFSQYDAGGHGAARPGDAPPPGRLPENVGEATLLWAPVAGFAVTPRGYREPA